GVVTPFLGSGVASDIQCPPSHSLRHTANVALRRPQAKRVGTGCWVGAAVSLCHALSSLSDVDGLLVAADARDVGCACSLGLADCASHVCCHENADGDVADSEIAPADGFRRCPVAPAWAPESLHRLRSGSPALW